MPEIRNLSRYLSLSVESPSESNAVLGKHSLRKSPFQTSVIIFMLPSTNYKNQYNRNSCLYTGKKKPCFFFNPKCLWVRILRRHNLFWLSFLAALQTVAYHLPPRAKCLVAPCSPSESSSPVCHPIRAVESNPRPCSLKGIPEIHPVFLREILRRTAAVLPARKMIDACLAVNPKGCSELFRFILSVAIRLSGLCPGNPRQLSGTVGKTRPRGVITDALTTLGLHKQRRWRCVN